MGNKIGRNELCPCGSGKKYKKCCLYARDKSDQEDTLTPLAQRINKKSERYRHKQYEKLTGGKK